MPKKPTAKIKSAAKAKMKKKPAPQAASHQGGMWKILEMKKARQKQIDQAHHDGRNHTGSNPATQPFARNTRFTKFAGPRRKVG